MLVAGINSGETKLGKPLRDGGAALILDGSLKFASSEERHTREKAAGGFQLSLESGLAEIGAGRPTHHFLSSCCELKPTEEKMNSVGHHYSHAISAHLISSFDSSIIIVMDDGGNVLEGTKNTNKWWSKSREQVSIYHAKGLDLKLVGREFDQPYQCGFGEFYRAFTYYLGWNSGRHAGKLMALSGLGSGVSRAKPGFFETINTRLSSRIKNFEPHDPISTARKFLASIGRSDLSLLIEQHGDFDAKVEVAALVQRELEYQVNELVLSWTKKLKLKTVCLTGGVALNCTMANYVRTKQNISLFIPPASSDAGQCLGNAISGYYNLTKKIPELGNVAFQGADTQITAIAVIEALNKYGVNASIIELHDQALFKNTAKLINDGAIVCWMQGRSEFGLRALGNRSILASPRFTMTNKKLNRIKGRENFNPFAASCISEDKDHLFENSIDSPHMTLAFNVNSNFKKEVPAVVHQDGTCRAQIFRRSFNPRYYDLLKEIKTLSGLGVVLNTSLNGPGEPIVESVDDGIAFFACNPSIKHMVLGNIMIEKKQS